LDFENGEDVAQVGRLGLVRNAIPKRLYGCGKFNV
jgi:hypothetical protein